MTTEPTAQVDQYRDPDTSSDDDCDMVPKPGYKFRWKQDQTGAKYNIEEQIREAPPEIVYKYVRDASGRSYKKLVPRSDTPNNLSYKWVTDSLTGKQSEQG